MRNAGLEETQAGIKIAGRNINNLRYADDTTLTAESESEVAQSCPTLCNLMDYNPPGFSIYPWDSPGKNTAVDFLVKAMAPHSSSLAWKIPWTEEPVMLQSMGSLSVRHD